jgi:hypothetical protein
VFSVEGGLLKTWFYYVALAVMLLAPTVGDYAVQGSVDRQARSKEKAEIVIIEKKDRGNQRDPRSAAQDGHGKRAFH